LALHQQAADELGCDDLGWAGIEGWMEVLGWSWWLWKLMEKARYLTHTSE